MELRSAVKEKEDQQRLKSKTRERTQPKMGKLDIDYQKLHDAFFRYQTKPKLTIHGELYVYIYIYIYFFFFFLFFLFFFIFYFFFFFFFFYFFYFF